MRIKFYGTRGSIPVCEREFQEFGGNTTCIEIGFDNGNILIFDAGSGIRNLGNDMIKSDHGQFDNIHICFSHFHMDHIQGLPFFMPAYDPKRKFTISAIGKDRIMANLKNIFEVPMQSEYFPVPFHKMGANIEFQQHQDNTIIEKNVKISVQKHQHPGGAYSYKIEDGKHRIVISTDIEHGETLDENIIEFAKGADVLIHDAQYTSEELVYKRNWGHSSYDQAIEVAERAGVSFLVLTHHDPGHNDDFLKKMEKQCQDRFSDCILAREKYVIEYS